MPKINGIVLISEVESSSKKRGLFQCPYCENTFEARIDHVRGGGTKSCGCIRKVGIVKHGHTSHAGYRSPEFKSWTSMQARCYGSDPGKQEAYRDKKIIVCERWLGEHGFENFLADMGERPKGKTLDRYPDNEGNYEPGNVRWATPKEQSRNLTTNLLVLYNGEQKTLVEWCEQLGLDYFRMRERIFRKGLSPEQAFTLPKRASGMYNRKDSVMIEFRGQQKSLIQWSNELGFSYEPVRVRIQSRGWSVEDAFTIPVFKKGEGGRINKEKYKAAQ